ncbi:MAG: hypothetical protein KDD45_11545, partial [Bdellovibrionales bacterium]|nr:hypothetical protein [Bdellovibrionales bacterium]
MGFYQDLKFGTDAERRLLEEYGIFEYAKDRSHDLVIIGTRIKCEHKADSYNPSKYPNVIIERWSMEGKPGGPFQAHKNGCRY